MELWQNDTYLSSHLHVVKPNAKQTQRVHKYNPTYYKKEEVETITSLVCLGLVLNYVHSTNNTIPYT